MSQQDVYDFLKKNRMRWVTSREIAEKTGMSMGRVGRALSAMSKAKEIQRKEVLIESRRKSIKGKITRNKGFLNKLR